MLNPLDFSGRRILVTGASSGIGLETAKLLSALGAKLVVTGRNQERLEQLLGELEGDGHHAFPADLSIAESIPSWMKTMTRSLPALSGSGTPMAAANLVAGWSYKRSSISRV